MNDIPFLPSDIEFDYAWTGLLGVGDSKIPIVKRLDDNIIVAVRMGGMGVAISSFIGREVSKMLS